MIPGSALFHLNLKTMLKTKLVKAGFFGHGAIFIMIAPFSIKLKAETLPYHTPLKTSVAAPLPKTDTVLLYKKDSVAFMAKEIMAAPSIRLNKTAAQFVKNYHGKYSDYLASIEKRSAPYFRIIEPILEKFELPQELKYLAVVESELRSNAVSRVGAKGPWQLMSATARELGLKVSGKRDERTHYYKSTVAAAKHLKSLYNEFGDWLLVIAAYNVGSGNVMKAIKKSGSRNFWKLQHLLPAETRGHVKRFIAVHYFFQENPSFTVLTRAETIAFLKKVKDYEEQMDFENEASPETQTEISER